MPLHVGTSGWQYRDWRDAFYPAGLPARRWLEHYAHEFATVEANSPFYRLPERSTFEQWAANTPPGFTVAVKASRYLTHVRRLRDAGPPVRLLLERAEGLGPKLGPVLVQLPPTMRCDTGRLAATLDAFPSGVRVAVEPRHESWHTDAVYELLAARDAALCLWDRLGRHGPLPSTANWCYLRLHEGRAQPRPCYGRAALASWVERLTERWGPSPDGYVYFNNDPGACAVRNARTFVRIAQAAGIALAPVPVP